MVKDRLNELKLLQNSQTTSSRAVEIESNEPDLEPENKTEKLRHTFERADVLNQWVEQVETNNRDVRMLLRKVEEIDHEKIVEDKLQSLFQNNTSLSHQISGKLKEIDKEIDRTKIETTESRIRTIQTTTLKTRFQNAFLDHNLLLETYKNIQKRIIKAQLQAKGYFQVSDEEVSLLLEEGTDVHVFTENILAETAEAKRILANVEERHQQLLQIERMLVEVRDLFIQMAILVESQQEVVDRIEYQAQMALDYVESGGVDLASARTKKKKFRKVWFIK